ncbi:MAG: glycosyltransferase, partial [Hyphomicrobiaceae bacterium]
MTQDRPAAHHVDGASSPQRVLIVTNKLWYMINHRLHLLRRLVDEGYQVSIAGQGTPDEKAQLETLEISVHLREFVAYRMSPQKDARLVGVIRSLVREEKPDIVHLFTVKPIVFGKLALRTLKMAHRPTKLVLSLTGLGRLFLPNVSGGIRFLRDRVAGAIARPVPGVVQSVTVETRADCDELLELSQLRRDDIVVTKGTGIDLDIFKPAPREGPIVFLFAGRLLHSKGAHIYLEAAKRLIAEKTDARFLLAGIRDP